MSQHQSNDFSPTATTLISTSGKDYTEVTVRLPNRMISKFEKLQKEWGLQSKGDVIARLFEEIFDSQQAA